MSLVRTRSSGGDLSPDTGKILDSEHCEGLQNSSEVRDGRNFLSSLPAPSRKRISPKVTVKHVLTEVDELGTVLCCAELSCAVLCCAGCWMEVVDASDGSTLRHISHMMPVTSATEVCIFPRVVNSVCCEAHACTHLNCMRCVLSARSLPVNSSSDPSRQNSYHGLFRPDGDGSTDVAGLAGVGKLCPAAGGRIGERPDSGLGDLDHLPQRDAQVPCAGSQSAAWAKG